MGKRKKITEWPFFRLVLTIISTILAVVVLTLSSLVIYETMNNRMDYVPTYLLLVFVFLGLMHFVLFLKDRTKIKLIKAITLLSINVILGIVVLFAKDVPFLFALTGSLFCVSIIISRIFNIAAKPNVRTVIYNVLIIIFAILIGLGLVITPTDTAENVQGLLLIECIFIAIVSFIEAMGVALAQLKLQVLIKVVVNTFSLEVIFGLLVTIASFSFLLLVVEEQITNYPDALWYCFNVVTSTGFGNGAETAIGRILTVLLGVYGLIAIAVVTSIIVNFYNETNGKKDAKEIKEIKDEVESNGKK